MLVSLPEQMSGTDIIIYGLVYSKRFFRKHLRYFSSFFAVVAFN